MSFVDLLNAGDDDAVTERLTHVFALYSAYCYSVHESQHEV